MAPAFAQTATTPQSAPASQQVQTSTSDQTSAKPADDQNLSAHQPLQPESREGFWGHLNPFARKKFVQRQMQPVRDRLNELDELSAKNSKDIKDVDSRATEGIRLASAKANEADQHAVDAGNRAQQAQQMAEQASTKLTTVEQTVSNIDQYQPVSDTEIRFRAGQAVLSQRAKDALDQIAESLKDQHGYVVEVQGFSSGKGAASIENSRNMAQSVVRYMVINHDIPVYRIHTVGMGNAPLKTSDGKTQRINGGRVEIAVLKNGIADLNQASGVAAQGVAPQQQMPANGNAQPAANSTKPSSSNNSIPR
jgi:outer membrane protein OmpA-like peptidoglycan-associated protein